MRTNFFTFLEKNEKSEKVKKIDFS